jgi:lipopolysaccharide biosynthesis glycosyltransferase
MRGALWIAVGDKAKAEARKSEETFKRHHRWPTKIITPKGLALPGEMSNDQIAHYMKVSMYQLSPFNPSVFLDADTEINGSLEVGLQILSKGWDLVMVPSFQPGGSEHRALWHLSREDRDYTFEQLGTWKHIMFNTGVMFFERNKRVESLMESWKQEWLRFKDRDQGAFLRALAKNPVRLWILGAAYNSYKGEIVNHMFGSAR